MIYWIKKFFSDTSAHWRALVEVAIIALFSLLLYVCQYLRKISTSLSAVGDVSMFEKGQMYLLAYSLFGTIIWLSFVRWDRPRHGARMFFGVIAIIVIIPVITFIGFDPTFSSIVNDRIIEAGYWIFAFFLVINYLLLFYSDISPPDATDTIHKGSEALGAKYRESLNEQG